MKPQPVLRCLLETVVCLCLVWIALACNDSEQASGQSKIKSKPISKVVAWGDILLQLPDGWKSDEGNVLHWRSNADRECYGSLALTDGTMPTDVKAAKAKAAVMLRCKPKELAYRKGFYGASVFSAERDSPKGRSIVLGRAVVVIQGKVYLHKAHYPYGTADQKQRAAEQWMIVYWLKPANIPKGVKVPA